MAKLCRVVHQTLITIVKYQRQKCEFVDTPYMVFTTPGDKKNSQNSGLKRGTRPHQGSGPHCKSAKRICVLKLYPANKAQGQGTCVHGKSTYIWSLIILEFNDRC